LGQRSVFAVVGHDFGSPVAATCAVTRPDVFHRLVMMSAPSAPPPAMSLGDAEEHGANGDVHADLRALERPRKHYQWYYSDRGAAGDMIEPPEGLHAFLRAYYHVKSADWPQNKPHKLSGWTADALAQMPTYYVMDADDTMPEAVRPHMPSPTEIAAAGWLSDTDLDVYVRAFQTTGFQPALNWYRCRTEGVDRHADQLFAGAPITVPATFIAGRQDWGIEQVPGARARMEAAAQDWRGSTLIDGAGHWVQQEKAAETTSALLAFLSNTPQAS
ncbi:MAG: alpha/beta hydrolase, partial [Pseudomonadota bacterium]